MPPGKLHSRPNLFNTTWGVSELTKDDRSPVTVADFAAQAIVASILRDADPSTPLVGEETSAVLREPENDALLGLVTEAVSSAIGQRNPEEILTLLDHGGHDASAPEYWVLDPVDGTKGFLRGEHFAVALGLVCGGHPTLGVLGCPNLHVDTSESPKPSTDKESSSPPKLDRAVPQVAWMAR